VENLAARFAIDRNGGIKYPFGFLTTGYRKGVRNLFAIGNLESAMEPRAN
jgi:hypothetical protein